MEKEFIPYELAVKMKAIGFDEPCIAKFINKQFAMNVAARWYKHNSNEITSGWISAPTFSQAFRWLYQKLDIEKGIMPLDTESQQLLLKELIDKVSSKHLLV